MIVTSPQSRKHVASDLIYFRCKCFYKQHYLVALQDRKWIEINPGCPFRHMPILGFWLFRSLRSACVHAAFSSTLHESAFNSKTSESTKVNVRGSHSSKMDHSSPYAYGSLVICGVRNYLIFGTSQMPIDSFNKNLW